MSALDSRRLKLPVNEIFGPVIQGEGPYAGRRCCFVRLGHCNLHCPPCDTKPTWDRTRFDLSVTCPEISAEDIVHTAVAHGAGDCMTVLSGGEPLLWQKTGAWATLLDCLPGSIHVETNGTIVPTEATAARVAHFSVSPKIDSRMGAADPYKMRIRPGVLARFAALASWGQACFKFVCGTMEDVDEVAALVLAHELDPDSVWIMPLGETDEEWRRTAPTITERAIGHHFNVSGRLHLTMGVR